MEYYYLSFSRVRACISVCLFIYPITFESLPSVRHFLYYYKRYLPYATFYIVIRGDNSVFFSSILI